MKKYIYLLLVIFLFGCTKVVTPVEIAKENPLVQEYLRSYPTARTDYSKTSVIDEKCSGIPDKEYYRVTFDAERDMVVYVDEEVVCSYLVGQIPAEAPEENQEEEVDTTVNIPQIEDVKMTGELKGQNTKLFIVEITDENIADSFELSFSTECDDWRVNPLKVYFNQKLVYDKVDCGETIRIPINSTTQGSYALKFETNYGTYNIKDLSYPSVPSDPFEITTETRKVVLAEYDTLSLGQPVIFNAENIKNVILTFKTNIQGMLKISLNDRVILEREVITPPTLRISEDFLKKENNTLNFEIGEYSEKCNDVSLEIYQHKNESIMCIVPGEDKLQMIFKNNGDVVIDNVDIFVKGKSTIVDNLDLSVKPGQIFTRVINFEDIGKIDEVIITPILEDGTRCKSLSFEEVNECE